jgi:hypothetical protein
MMPVIRITDATWERLKKFAIPLEDTPEDVVCKILNAAEEYLKHNKYSNVIQQPMKTRIIKQHIQKGLKTPEIAYRKPILEAIYELGGKASVAEILKNVEIKMKSLLNDFDYQRLPSGETRWSNTAKWERKTLVKKEGLLKTNSPKGIWELTEKGFSQVKHTN